jgi:hypothetical protein
LRLRPGRIDDADKVGKIIFEAFSAIADKHGFPSDFPSVDIGRSLASSFLSNPGLYSVVLKIVVVMTIKVWLFGATF